MKLQEVESIMEYCINDPCDAEAVTERNDKPYCYTCAEAYDRGYEDAISYIAEG